MSIGAAPVSSTAILAALVAVLAFTPASVVVVGMGGGWPFRDVVAPLVGLLLGPIAGPLAAIIGVVVGGGIANCTNLRPWGFLIGGMSALTVAMIMLPCRSPSFIPWIITAVLNVIYFFQSTSFGIIPMLWSSNVFTVHIALLLIAVPPIRIWAIDQIRSGGPGLSTFAAFFIVLFLGSTAGVQANWMPAFATNPWPAEAWPALIWIIAVERIVFAAVGAPIGTALIAAIRWTSRRAPSPASPGATGRASPRW